MPRRLLSVRHGAATSVFSAKTDRVLAWAAAPADGEDESPLDRIDLLARTNADGPGEAALAESLTERRGEAIAGQYTAETQAGCACSINLGERDL